MREQIHNWLIANKIFFETVTTTVLALMAIIISITQTFTAIKQTDLITLQTQVAEAQALPQFELALHPKLNEQTGKFDDNNLIITNRGGPVHNFAASEAYFICVTGGLGGMISKNEVPVDDYFAYSFTSTAGVGDLVQAFGIKNNASVIALARDIRNLADAKKMDYGILDEKLIVRLVYRDLLDRLHDDYYEVRPISGGTRMEDGIGRTIFKTWIEATKRYHLSDLKAENLLKDVARIEKHHP